LLSPLGGGLAGWVPLGSLRGLGRYWSDELAVANGPLSPATIGTPWRAPLSIYYSFASSPGGQDVVRLETRMAQIPGNPQAMTYDADGNLTNDGIWSYTWDGENRLIQLVTVAAASTGYPQITLTFRYDYLGRRVEKLVIDKASNRLLTGRRFLYDGWNLIAEYSLNPQLSTLSLFRSYTWGLDITRTLTDAGGVGALLQIADHRSGKTYFPAYDGNGNITALVNSTTGTVAAAYEYSPFGEQLRADAPDPVVADQPFRFSTKYTDSETGLVYYGRRYYDAKQGRFVGRDTIEEKGGRNLYAFARNNAINVYDLLGMLPVMMAPFIVREDPIWDDGLNLQMDGGGGGRFIFDFGGGDGGGGRFDKDANKVSIERKVFRASQRCDELESAINKAQMAVAAYSSTAAPPGSQRVTADELAKLPQAGRDMMNMSNGLSISVFVNSNGSYTIGYRGTEPTLADIATDIGNAVGFVTGQYSNAINFAVAFRDAYGSAGLDFVGHSLGGGLAAAASMRTGLTATTFNAAGVGAGIISDQNLNTANARTLITNYHNPLDPLTLGQVLTPLPNASGTQVTVPMASLATSGHASTSVVTNMLADYGKRGCND
jgi:RHS repeat-associated protein